MFAIGGLFCYISQNYILVGGFDKLNILILFAFKEKKSCDPYEVYFLIVSCCMVFTGVFM